LAREPHLKDSGTQRSRTPFGEARLSVETVCTVSRTEKELTSNSRPKPPSDATLPNRTRRSNPRWCFGRSLSAGAYGCRVAGPVAPRRQLRRNSHRRFGACMRMVSKTVVCSKLKAKSKCNFLCTKIRLFHKIFRRYPQTFPHFLNYSMYPAEEFALF
jgi:hypothetical protein